MILLKAILIGTFAFLALFSESQGSETTVEEASEAAEPVDQEEAAENKDAEPPRPVLPVFPSLLAMQPQMQTQAISHTMDGKAVTTTLQNLNPKVGGWFLLKRTGVDETFHLENPFPGRQNLTLDQKNGQLLIGKGPKQTPCDFFSEQTQAAIQKFRDENKSYTPICHDTLYVRNPIEGRQTAKEFLAGFLRDHVWGGEEITTLVKETLYKDKFLLKSEGENKEATLSVAAAHPPLAADQKQGDTPVVLEPKEVGIKRQGSQAKASEDEGLVAGQWYETEAQPGVFLSLYRANLVPESVMATHKDRVGALDAVEKEALVVLVAMDLDQFDINFAIGTEHPRVGWSERVPAERVVPTIKGPDGFDTMAPLVGTGKVPPHLRSLIDVTFVGGFKRSHGAFKWGSLAMKNHGSHYGWMEQGVLFSRLQPGLATVLIDQKGEVRLKTWKEGDDQTLLPTLKHARQNGVPIIEEGVPGRLVNHWGAGNWSGSIDSKQRTLRAALCEQTSDAGHFLIYGYFSTATPNAMARVFQAYKCGYAIHLDMNALEHTYFALYGKDKDQFRIDHLNVGMDVLDSKHKGEALPRFVGQADNRDFFYLMRKGATP